MSANAAEHRSESAFPGMDVPDRVRKLRERITAEGLDALLVTQLVNIRYLTGFTGSAALLLVKPDDLLFVSDGRYGQQAAEQLGAAGVDARIEIAGVEQRRITSDATRGARRLGLEAHAVTWAQRNSFADQWFAGEGFERLELVATTGLVEDLRRRKDPGEVARIGAACAIADEALSAVRSQLCDRPSERDFALELEMTMRRLGASGVSFDPIVAGGPNGAKPHARPSDRRINPDELLVLDFGCMVDGYCSDMTRTVASAEPSVEAREMYAVVLESHEAGLAAVHEGATCAEVDEACRRVIEAVGWGDAFMHGTGHGVGLEIHEAPRVGQTSNETLFIGDVVTVEPGVYIPGVGGVRIEDTVVVTPGGYESLTRTTKELVS